MEKLENMIILKHVTERVLSLSYVVVSLLLLDQKKKLVHILVVGSEGI